MPFAYTPRLVQLMEFIRDYYRKNRMTPTLEEMGANFGIHRVTVHQHVSSLVRKGALARNPAARSRAIIVLDPAYQDTVERVCPSCAHKWTEPT